MGSFNRRVSTDPKVPGHFLGEQYRHGDTEQLLNWKVFFKIYPLTIVDYHFTIFFYNKECTLSLSSNFLFFSSSFQCSSMIQERRRGLFTVLLKERKWMRECAVKYAAWEAKRGPCGRVERDWLGSNRRLEARSVLGGNDTVAVLDAPSELQVLQLPP